MLIDIENTDRVKVQVNAVFTLDMINGLKMASIDQDKLK